jgi:hypothetical protein
MISNFGFHKREKCPSRLLCNLLFTVYRRVQTTCGEDTQKCNFSHCFPECGESVFSEMSVAYQTTRIPRSEFWHVPASLNCDFEMYLQVWTVSKFNVQDASFMWIVSSILFVVRRICNEPLRAKFSVSNAVPVPILGAIFSSGSKARIKWTSCDLITFGVGLAFVDKDFVQCVA